MKNSHLIALAALIYCVPENDVYANESNSLAISANTALVSDYIFRGISQSDENFAVQGGLDVEHSSGLYAGAWASNVDFNDGDEANVEIDIYAGYASEIKGISYDIGGVYYAYPGADSSLDYDFGEIYGSLGYDFKYANAAIGVYYSPNFFGDSGNAVYTHIGVGVPLPNDFTISSNLGYQSIDDNASFGTPDYTDWNLSLAYDWKNVTTAITYYDTDLSEPGECSDGCDSRIVFSVTAEFGIQ